MADVAEQTGIDLARRQPPAAVVQFEGVDIRQLWPTSAPLAVAPGVLVSGRPILRRIS